LSDRPRHEALLLATLLTLTVAGAAAGGRVGLTPTFRAELDRGDGEVCTFLIEIDPVLFRIGTFAGKYKVLRMEVENFGRSAIQLNPSRDAISVHFPGRDPVSGVLDLSRADPETWNLLPLDLKIALAYPQGIEPRQARAVYVFLPAPDLDDLPSEIDYRIHSLPGYGIRLLAAPAMRD
jgi:hypothetical protein